MRSIAQVVVNAWEYELRTSEDPFQGAFLADFLGRRRRSYREELDRVRINHYGEPIPRIELVRKNLRRLGNIRLDPARLPE